MHFIRTAGANSKASAVDCAVFEAIGRRRVTVGCAQQNEKSAELSAGGDQEADGAGGQGETPTRYSGRRDRLRLTANLRFTINIAVVELSDGVSTTARAT